MAPASWGGAGLAELGDPLQVAEASEGSGSHPLFSISNCLPRDRGVTDPETPRPWLLEANGLSRPVDTSAPET